MRSGVEVVMGNGHVNGATSCVTGTPRGPGGPSRGGCLSRLGVVSRTASVRAPESVFEVGLDPMRRDRLQQIPDRGQVLLPKHRKLAHQLIRPADVRQILVAVWKRHPVVARKGDAGACR